MEIGVTIVDLKFKKAKYVSAIFSIVNLMLLLRDLMFTIHCV